MYDKLIDDMDTIDKNSYLFFTLEEQIIHHLMLQTVSLKKNGLMYGKSGIALFFFEYGKYYHNPVFIDYGNELINSILSRINYKVSNDFSTGLCGFGWCLEYLMYRKFINCSHNSICIKIDKCVMKNDVRRFDDLSLEIGIEGLLHYVMIRMHGTKERKQNKPFDSIFMNDIYGKLCTISEDDISDDLKKLKLSFISFFEKGMYLYKPNLSFLIDNTIVNSEKDYLLENLGLSNGLSGKLLQSIYYF